MDSSESLSIFRSWGTRLHPGARIPVSMIVVTSLTAMTLVLEWASERRNQITEDWNLCSQLQPPKPIEPLK